MSGLIIREEHVDIEGEAPVRFLVGGSDSIDRAARVVYSLGHAFEVAAEITARQAAGDVWTFESAHPGIVRIYREHESGRIESHTFRSTGSRTAEAQDAWLQAQLFLEAWREDAAERVALRAARAAA